MSASRRFEHEARKAPDRVAEVASARNSAASAHGIWPVVSQRRHARAEAPGRLAAAIAADGLPRALTQESRRKMSAHSGADIDDRAREGMALAFLSGYGMETMQ